MNNDEMAIVYKDIGQLSQKSSVAGTEKIEVSDTEYITPSQIVSGKADLASPALTGTPTAPTASAGTNTTQIATTAFVQSAISGVGGLPSVSTFGQFIESYYDTTSQTYKWHVSGNVYINSAAALQNDLSGGFLGTIYVTKAGPRSNTEFQFDNRGLVAEAWANNAVFSDWSWIKYRSSYSPSAYVTLQDYLNKRVLPEAVSGLYGSLPTVVYDSTNGYHWGTTGFYISSGILNSENYGSFRAWVNSSGDYIEFGSMEDGLFCSYASTWSWIKIPGNGQTYTTLQDTLDLKAPLASPALTGVPTAPTAASGTNTTQIATTAFVQAAVSGGGGSTTDCVHKTGDETIAGDKTFTDDIVVGDASNIKYGASSGGGFTQAFVEIVTSDNVQTVQAEVEGEPKAFIVTNCGNTSAGLLMVVGDSSGCHGVYSAASTRQNNYTSDFTVSYSNGTLTITAPNTTYFMDGGYSMVYYYGSGTLNFRTTSFAPGSGATTATFTDANLTAVPAFYACLLESQVNNESYRRVACYTNAGIGYDGNDDPEQVPLGLSFFSSSVSNTTSSFTVSYNNGLVINSGGTNAGGYFHNPGTYTLYYLMASDIGGGGGSYQSLSAELSAITTSVSAKEATSNKVTSLSAQSTDTQYPSAKLVYDQLALKQGAITISSSEPTAYQGNNGDIWIVI